MKYKEEFIEKVRKGEAQIQVDGDEKWGDLLKYIFGNENIFAPLNYYSGGQESRFYPVPNLPIIHAKDFIIQETKVNLAEFRYYYEHDWKQRLLLVDLGEQIVNRFITVAAGEEQKYINGESGVSISAYSQMREIQEPELLTHKQIEGLIGKPFKYVEG